MASYRRYPGGIGHPFGTGCSPGRIDGEPPRRRRLTAEARESSIRKRFFPGSGEG
jgi:hypothetical protein